MDRCVAVGKNALIVKSADTLDSFYYYKEAQNEIEMERSRHIARLILQHVDVSTDPIFEKLKQI
ncbi:MAG: hypothetical protein COV59_04115 [Candidatus Magasanikbacteria bacterium CG11_big_fil_rev_8_21_14_0_20_39_34]|uniref:Uncharacterized protein n=1 Tax=Candidatus Magasanikbacteria bacterium CG11_big_fil_rev_8_21_14_0_20_39_34 TaxID=1974653 RepID=A0A2H0N6T1_9BACT|nr:MAG: hypothetical protein COV59_04115 [Candidatus Magasanikbacteria bacterium CG11_big_fil_rev_8_21_14_0_20_39_34]